MVRLLTVADVQSTERARPVNLRDTILAMIFLAHPANDTESEIDGLPDAPQQQRS